MLAMLQFLQYKTFGNHAIPGSGDYCGCGKPAPEYTNKSVREFDVGDYGSCEEIEVERFFGFKEYVYVR